jgi:hypothetical protein
MRSQYVPRLKHGPSKRKTPPAIHGQLGSISRSVLSGVDREPQAAWLLLRVVHA